MVTVRRRGTTSVRALLASAVVIVLSAVVPMSAAPVSAQTIAQTRAEIAHLSSQLAQEEKAGEVTANQYDAKKAELATLDSDVRVLEARETVSRAQIALTTKHMVKSVIASYVFDLSTTQSVELFNTNPTEANAREVFERIVVGNLNGLRVKLAYQRKQLDRVLATTATERAQANTDTQNLQSLLAANIAATAQTRSTLTAVTATLKNQIIAYEVSAGAAAARAGNTSAESSAVAAASQVGGQAAANQVLAAIAANTPKTPTSTQVSGSPAGSAQGEAAVAWAEKEIGVPYVWGGETPGVGFDCSGLVQWAWGKVGFTIPRTTEEQWASLPHVSLTPLPPGDLLYYYNLDGDNEVDHVVMYVGSGPWGTNTIIAAPYTGTDVGLAPLFTGGLEGAARP